LKEKTLREDDSMSDAFLQKGGSQVKSAWLF